jgi:hypothetical protein
LEKTHFFWEFPKKSAFFGGIFLNFLEVQKNCSKCSFSGNFLQKRPFLGCFFELLISYEKLQFFR